MTVSVVGLASFDRSVQEWFGAVERAVEQAAVGLAKEAFEHALEMSPQFSGDFVANWKVGIGAPNSGFTPQAVSPNQFWKDPTWEPFKRGDEPAMRYARAHADWSGYHLGQDIYLSNSAHHHGDSYAFKIEDGTIKFRPVNEGADHVARRSARYVAHKYQNITRAQLKALQRLGP